uniref:BMA-ADT-1 n=1 Tax=Brugia malayi TaxID=6279 RepID=A0A1I9GCH3_BRUMA|nr:BMA-ADT-1 [Brugia malayi]
MILPNCETIVARGSYCIGSSFDQRSCISRTACIGTPINGRWTSWSEWSQCSDPYGHRSRMRFCSNPRPSEGDFQRVGSDFEITSCDDISRLFHCSSLLMKMHPERNNLKQS